MSLLPRDLNGCPFLILAPMEGVGDRTFRRAIASVGGFDEAVKDFLRVPKNAHIKSLAKEYQADELAPIPLAAQLMGSDLELMAEMAQEIERRGAPRIDLNCGCPSNTVTGRGAGSSLLREPNHLYEVAKALVQAVSIPVTLKMRSGFEDTSLFEENLFAAQESGVCYLTLHPRTKVDGYGPPARWDLIAKAKTLLQIPVVGNGDILTVDDAKRMLKETNCDALMIGRGSVINPFLFHQIRASYAQTSYQPTWNALVQYLGVFMQEFPAMMTARVRVNKLKQLCGFLFKANPKLILYREQCLGASYDSPEEYLEFVLQLIQQSNTFA